VLIPGEGLPDRWTGLNVAAPRALFFLCRVGPEGEDTNAPPLRLLSIF